MATKLDHIYGVGGQVGNLANRVTSLETNAAKKNEANTFTQSQTVPGLTLRSENTNAKFIAFNNSGTRIGYVGKASSGDNNDMTIQSNGKIILQAPNNINANNKIIENVGTPTANNHAATKQYVDTHGSFTKIKEQDNAAFRSGTLEYDVTNIITGTGVYEILFWLKDRSNNRQLTLPFSIYWVDRNNWVYSNVVSGKTSDITTNNVNSAPTWFVQLLLKTITNGTKICIVKSGTETDIPSAIDFKIFARKIG